MQSQKQNNVAAAEVAFNAAKKTSCAPPRFGHRRAQAPPFSSLARSRHQLRIARPWWEVLARRKHGMRGRERDRRFLADARLFYFQYAQCQMLLPVPLSRMISHLPPRFPTSSSAAREPTMPARAPTAEGFTMLQNERKFSGRTGLLGGARVSKN